MIALPFLLSHVALCQPLLTSPKSVAMVYSSPSTRGLSAPNTNRG